MHRQSLARKNAYHTKRQGQTNVSGRPNLGTHRSITVSRKGAYKFGGRFAGMSKAAGSALGKAIGNMISPGLGGAAGDRLGGWIGQKFGNATGLGAYRVSRNTLLAPDPPNVKNTNAGVRIRHREYIGDVLASEGFSLQYAIDIQPGLESSFPWLSGIAQQYEQYEMHGLLYEFITTSGNSVASTSTSLGEVLMATQYNSVVPNFTTKAQMANQQFSSFAVPSVDIIHPIECDPKETTLTKLYVRSSTNQMSDVRFSDLGVFQLATLGNPNNGNTLGSLYCTYDCEFFKPTLNNDTSLSLQQAVYLSNSASVTAANQFGTGQNGDGTRSFSPNGLNVYFVAASNSFTIPVSNYGYYMFTYFTFGAGSTMAVAVPTLGLVNCTAAPNPIPNTNWLSPLAPLDGATSATGDYMYSFIVMVTDPSQSVIISFVTNTGTIPTGGQCQVVIYPIEIPEDGGQPLRPTSHKINQTKPDMSVHYFELNNFTNLSVKDQPNIVEDYSDKEDFERVAPTSIYIKKNKNKL